MNKRRIAFVVQRYGEEVNGGAEVLARWLAEHLLALAEVHVITTCALDFHTWADHYPAGDSLLNGVAIHRFAVDAPRDWDKASRHTGQLLITDHTLFDEVQWMKTQGPYSTPLFNYLQATYTYFDAFVFVTYAYATTFFGLPLVSDKAILVPNAHEEPYLHLPVLRPLFHLPQAIIYNTEPERQLVQSVWHNERVLSEVAGVGVNVPATITAARFRQKYGLHGDFLLYVGRVDRSKNVPELLDHFVQYKQDQPDNDLKLVLIGRPHFDLPQHPDVVALGFVSEEDKFEGMAAATAVVMPSLYESLSIIALESWLMGTPVLVNGRCAVLKYQCRQSNGGLYYTNYAEFALSLSTLLQSASLRQTLGQQGGRYVQKTYSWDSILHKYQTILNKITR